MKKILTHLTGIVFVIAILAIGSCNKAVPPPQKPPKKVTVYMEAKIIEGEMHLKMWDSSDPANKVTDTLTTIVKRRTKITWELAENSGIKSIESISPLDAGKIMHKSAEQNPDTKKLEHKVRLFISQPFPREKYIIEFLDLEDELHSIDPYLKIPDQ